LSFGNAFSIVIHYTDKSDIRNNNYSQEKMIGFLQGKVIKKTSEHILVDVNGVGYKVSLSGYALEQCRDENISLYIYTHVREQEISLYGFLEEQEQEIFELLISVSGIGPKAALNILTIADVTSIITAIANEDTSILTKVSGIGAKTAKKVVNELLGKVVAPIDVSSGSAVENSDAIDALRSMGYSVVEARDALGNVSKDVRGVGERVKAALKYLGK
jgi:holliday junction DNA helicase RuvA